MNIENFEHAVLELLEDMKAIDPTRLDVRSLTSVTDTMIIASGSSERQLKAIANRLAIMAKEQNKRPLGIEDEGGWILVDLGDLIVHLMTPSVREFYNLEKLWGMIEQRREAGHKL